MKEYDIIAIGTGSAMNIVSTIIESDTKLKIAVIDKDEPGGICLTKGCIPTKILLFPAEIIRLIQNVKKLGIIAEIKEIDFKFIMERMRSIINHDIKNIESNLTSTNLLDYYKDTAEFIDPYTLRVGKEEMKGKIILLCTGSKPTIPNIRGLDKISFHTSDSILQLNELPKSLCIIGGGYIAAEYGHFFSTMGSEVTIIGRNSQFLPREEPEISVVARNEFQNHMKIFTNYEVKEVSRDSKGKILTEAINKESNDKITIISDEILIATGRSSNSDILNPTKSGIKTDKHGWIEVNEYLQTSKPNIWAFGDANGKYLFKHVANYESKIVFYNAFQGKQIPVDYHAIPHAVFSNPEIASVGLRESEAIEEFGEKDIIIGFHRYEDTAKGMAMDVKRFFVKITVYEPTMEILGAHIIGPQASVLIQEIINLMYTSDRSIRPLVLGMHIHPALNEVVERAAGNLMSVKHYHHYLEHLGYNLKG